MSTVSKSLRGFSTKGILFWFVLSAGIVACFLMYRNPHIAFVSLLKHMVVYGAIATFVILLAKKIMYRIAKTLRKNQRKKKREERRIKMHLHQKKLKDEVLHKSHRRSESTSDKSASTGN